MRSGSVGNFLEWFDFALYGMFANEIAAVRQPGDSPLADSLSLARSLLSLSVRAPLAGCLSATRMPPPAQTFFPVGDAATQLLESFAVFAGAFVMRPVGGVLFGYIGDKYGRVYSMRLAMSLMALPTTAIAILPGYATLGILSTILLTIIRLIQGLSVGGAFGGLMTYAMEITPPHRVGFVSALLKVFSSAGTLVGSLVAALMHTIYTDAELLEWAWRLPFALGIGVSVVGIWMRRGLREAAQFEEAKANNKLVESAAGLGSGLWAIAPAIVRVIVVINLNNIGFYVFFTWLPAYLTNARYWCETSGCEWLEQPWTDAVAAAAAAEAVEDTMAAAAAGGGGGVGGDGGSLTAIEDGESAGMGGGSIVMTQAEQQAAMLAAGITTSDDLYCVAAAAAPGASLRAGGGAGGNGNGYGYVYEPCPWVARPLSSAYSLNALFMVYVLGVEVWGGMLSDRRGSPDFAMAIGATGVLLATPLAFYCYQSATASATGVDMDMGSMGVVSYGGVWSYVAGSVVVGGFLGLYIGPMTWWMSMQLPDVATRNTAMGLTYNVAAMVSGAAPAVATAIVAGTDGDVMWVGIVTSAIALVSVLALCCGPTFSMQRRKHMMHHDHRQQHGGGSSSSRAGSSGGGGGKSSSSSSPRGGIEGEKGGGGGGGGGSGKAKRKDEEQTRLLASDDSGSE